MSTYHSVLGVTEDADQAKIKKAYFRLLRVHSPENDPDGFRKIREAYDELRKNGGKENGPKFPPLKDPFAVKMQAQIDSSLKAGNNALARETCEEACRLFPKEIRFLYELCMVYRRSGNVGKAVNTAKKLVSIDGANPFFHKELALSLYDRGFNNKACEVFKKAYELGCRDYEFLEEYGSYCFDMRNYKTGRDVLMELFSLKKSWEREESQKYIDSWCTALFHILTNPEDEDSCHSLSTLTQYVKTHEVFFSDNIRTVAFAIYERMIPAGLQISDENPVLSVPGIREGITELADTLLPICKEKDERELLENIKGEIVDYVLEHDERINSLWRLVFEALNMPEAFDRSVVRFAILDMKLCMIAEWEAIRKDIPLIEKDYTELYEKINTFLNDISDADKAEGLKARLISDYERLAPYYQQNYFYERHPEERKKLKGTVVHGNSSGSPYVRTGKKIGRNDPCPCGSGKKYKNCCGR